MHVTHYYYFTDAPDRAHMAWAATARALPRLCHMPPPLPDPGQGHGPPGAHKKAQTTMPPTSQLVYCSHFWTLFKCLLNTVSEFFQFFQNFIKFLHNISTVSLQVFLNFFRINSNLSCDFLKASTEKSEIFLKFQNNFSISFISLFQKSQKCSQNFWKIISQFFEKICINAKFLRISSKLFYYSYFWTLFQYFPKTVFRTFPNFIRFLCNFSTLAVSQMLISYFLTIFL